MKWRVRVAEVWNSYIDVEADSYQQAIELAGEGEGDEQEDLREYSYTLDSDLWDAEEIRAGE